MKKDRNGKGLLRWFFIFVTIIAASTGTWMSLRGQTNAPAAAPGSSKYTPAHPSVSSAFREFFNVRSKPVQPIAYTHTVHVLKDNGPRLECSFCHVGVDKGPVASIPGANTCMGCHDSEEGQTPHAKEEIKKIVDYATRGEEIPWQRVYGFPAMSHVRFNHAPHIRNNVDCSTCHGDIPHMTVAERVVQHTMGFCVKCHEDRKVSNECMTCHY
jgi:nitrate/TMAO reductase-like tetraheme cytochrome c subunit